MQREEIEEMLRESLEKDANKARPRRSLVEGIVPRLEGRRERRGWRVFMPRTRLAWAVAAIALALVGGTAYAGTSLIRDMMRTMAPDIEDAGLMTELNLSQTIDGVTVKLEAGYADANTVLIGYTITGRNARYDAPDRRMYVADGLELDSSAGTGYVPGPDVLGWHPSKTTVVAAFDGTPIPGDPSEVALRFETSVSDTPVAGEGRTWGPFVFDFTLPFRGGKNVTVGQTVEAAGIPITLEKVLISPAGTSAVFHYYEDRELRDRPFAITSIEMPVGDETITVNAKQGALNVSYYMEHYPGDFTQRTGLWTLTVRELVLPAKSPGPHKASDTIRIAGPWVFRFDVP